METDPNGYSPSTPGAKLDAGKTPVFSHLFEYFPRALAEVTKISEFGAQKYTRMGWVDVPDGIGRYSDAGLRHTLATARGEDIDSDSGLPHAAHAAWNALAVLELKLREMEEDAETIFIPVNLSPAEYERHVLGKKD